MNHMYMIYVIFGVFALLSWIISARLNYKFKKYSQIPVGYTGKQIAEKMLRDSGITDVQVTCTPGHLTDHYNPATKTVNLSESVYDSNSVAAAILLAGIIFVNSFPELLLAGIVLFATTTLFSFITLPVEINASKRALIWLESAGITDYSSHEQAKDALKSAAYTYVVAALGSLATLIYYILIFLGGRRD